MGITQDEKGYIWITTGYKLVRFDGYHFESFDPHKQFTDVKPYFYPGLVEDNDGMLWMNSLHGLFSFDPRTSKFRRFKDGGRNNPFDGRINLVYKDRNSNVWVGTAQGLTQVLKRGDSITFKQYSGHYAGDLLAMLDTVVN